MESMTSIRIKAVIVCIIVFLLGACVAKLTANYDIASTKLIEPYKIIYTKVEGKVVKTYYYKQQ